MELRHGTFTGQQNSYHASHVFLRMRKRLGTLNFDLKTVKAVNETHLFSKNQSGNQLFGTAKYKERKKLHYTKVHLQQTLNN